MQRSMARWPTAFALLLSAAFAFGSSLRAQAQPVEEFFRGKTIEFLIGAASGGGYDLAGRTLAQHIGRHIPGQPQIVVRNMPAASSLAMTNHLYNAAKRDGTVWGMTNNNIPLEPRLKLFSPDGANLKFDISRFIWLGTPLQEPQALFVWHTSPARSVADLRTHKVLVGAVTVAADNYTLQLLLNRTYGTIMEFVTGYPGQNDIFLAMERGEVQGNSSGVSNLLVSRPQLLKEGKVRVLVQYGTERHPAFKDVPTAIELMSSEADRELWRVYSMKYAFARPIALPPEVPADRVQALRAAFDATLKDPQYVAEAQRIGLDINPLGGEAVARLVAQVQATPEPVIARLRELLTPPAKAK